MTAYLIERTTAGAIPLTPLSGDTLTARLAAQPPGTAVWVRDAGFTGAPGTICLVPGPDGTIARVLAGIDAQDPLWSYAGLPGKLGPLAAQAPERHFVLDADLDEPAASTAALGWTLGTYAFQRYRKSPQSFANLVWPKGAGRAAVLATAEAVFLVRDLINTPASDMGPEELAKAAANLARHHKAKCSVTVGDDLLKKNYPAVHAVGRASARAPRLIDLRWGTSGRRITLVGKGVCFDTGGLDLKPSAGMKLMKKDMGGAAHVLGLAHMIMAMRLPVRLRVLIPAVENSVSGNAMRPLDVLSTRKGLTVEVGNTDAEGRLILADALYEADGEDPDLIVDFATLTGAARVALGPSLPALFCNDDTTADAMLRHSQAQGDPVWRLPLHQPYRPNLESKVADLNNISSDSFAGAIIAALFMAEFVRPTTPWMHLDVLAWNVKGVPGRPEGGEAMGMRAAYALIAELAGKPAGAKERPKTGRKKGRSSAKSGRGSL
jgi:leucyl aminopeptidase